MKTLLVFGIMAMILSSCSIQRRLYNSGFHIEGISLWSKNENKQPSGKINSKPSTKSITFVDSPSFSNNTDSLFFRNAIFLNETPLLDKGISTPIFNPKFKKNNAKNKIFKIHLKIPQSKTQKIPNNNKSNKNRNNVYTIRNQSTKTGYVFYLLGYTLGGYNSFALLFETLSWRIMTILSHITILLLIIAALLCLKGIIDAIHGEGGAYFAIISFIGAIGLILFFSFIFYSIAGLPWLDF